MKGVYFMSLIDRIILTIYSFCLTVISAFFLLVSLRIIDVDFFWTNMEEYLTRWETISITLVFLVVSIKFLFSGIKRDNLERAIITETSLGQVKISLTAIENCIIKAAKEVSGIKSIKADIKKTQDGICVTLKLKVAPDLNIPDTAKAVQEKIKLYIEKNLGTHIQEIKIFIENISGTGKPRVT